MNPYSFQEYEIITYQNNHNKLYKFFLALIIIGIIVLICRFKFNIYEKVLLFKDKDSYYILIDMNKSLNKEKNSYLRINGKKYNYKFISENEEITNINGTLYKAINIDINIDKYEEKYMYTYYLRKSNTIMDMIFEFIGGGNT